MNVVLDKDIYFILVYILIIIFWYVRETSVIGRETVANKAAPNI